MAQEQTQTYANHAKFVPGYHAVTFGILVINFAWGIYRAATSFSADSVLGVLLAIALLLLFFYARGFALTVQDRVIRLEMKLRLREVLPPDLHARINDFTVAQLVSLRFASDAELPELAKKVLADNLSDRKVIKQMVQHWQADHLRA